MEFILVGVASFFTGIGIMLFLFYEEIFDKRKVGYGENDIHPDKGVVG